MKKHIVWLSTGGTIACAESSDGLAPVGGEDFLQSMLDCIPDIRKFCNVEYHTVANLDSTNIQPSDWIHIADEINKYADKCDGIVITHGTDTMAYTTAMMSYMLQNPPVPIVFTGSQLPFFAENSDGVANLYNAFAVACAEELCTVCIVFDNRIIRGTEAYKAFTRSRCAFISRGKYLGRISDGKVHLYE